MKKYMLFTVFLLFFDTMSKFFAEKYLIQNQITIIPGLLSLEYAQNIGIAFSLPLTGTLLKIITLVLILGIFWYYWTQEKQKKSKIINISYSLIFAGALGNAWERIFREYVTDMISVEYFAIFNLADSYICLGAIGLIYYYHKNKS